MPEQKSIVENWITENESKLKQISVENKPLYESVFLALEYLNNSLGGKVITAPVIEPVATPETPKTTENYKKVYLTKNLSSNIGNNIKGGSLGMVLGDSFGKYLIAWDKTEYEVYNGNYKKEMFTGVDPIFNIGDNVGFPTTQFQTPLGTPAMFIIIEAENKGDTTLKIVEMNFGNIQQNDWTYSLSNDIRDNKIGFNLKDLLKAKSIQHPIMPKAEKTSKPRLKYKKGQEVIDKTDPTSIYEIIDLTNTTSTQPNYKLSSKTDATKLDFWIYAIDLEKDYNISQKKSISLPIKEETQTQQTEFEDLANELDNLEI